MPVLIQHLRTPTGTALPATLEPGQIAFNLANNWMLVGNGGAEILVDGIPLGTYGGPLTVLGVAGVAVPSQACGGQGLTKSSRWSAPLRVRRASIASPTIWLRLRLVRAGLQTRSLRR